MDILELAILRIRKVRRELKLSQAEAGARVHMVQNTWANYETGRTKIDLPTLQLMARALERPPEYFITPDLEEGNLSREVAARFGALGERDQTEILQIIEMKERLARASSNVRAVSPNGGEGVKHPPPKKAQGETNRVA